MFASTCFAHVACRIENNIKWELLRSFAGSVILKITYGHDARESHDPLIEKVDEAMAHFSELLKIGTYMVDFLPVLRFFPEWMPGGGFQKSMRHFRATMEEMMNIPFDMVKNRIVSEGNYLRCRLLLTAAFFVEGRKGCLLLRL